MLAMYDRLEAWLVTEPFIQSGRNVIDEVVVHKQGKNLLEL